ncbi:hypothetical protein [Actinomadura harenae]|uniref:ARB-07466-like C-terminal domain-containing protein n=1 Tax=Actinomadura harenae TaxID=2483351 RepID=A0A3M2KY95_9ACTN|nr:hypothetical protein [Actinomadura harenae]RMI30489.1 hypothetical protein EBO15_42925 [Actinomadura harenae]
MRRLGHDRRRGRALPAVVGAAVTATLAANVAVIASGAASPEQADPGRLVAVADGAAAPKPPTVAPLSRTLTPHLLVAGTGTLPPDAVARVRRLKGVAGATVVDAARAQVAGRQVGLLGVDPSDFRAFVPKQSGASDQLWQTIATGGLAVSFTMSQDGSVPLGQVVPAGSASHPGRLRVAAYAALGIQDVDAVVSRGQARALGMPDGNALLVSAPKLDSDKLQKQIRGILPKGTKVAVLNAPAKKPVQDPTPRSRPEVSGRPDGVSTARSPITGNTVTPTMRDVVMEIDGTFGPFPTIGCYRGGADAQDHADGRACDFMESSGGAMPSASAQRHGDQVAAYAVANASRLGISYVIWKQHIWNIARASEGWRPMADRGGITANHYDHVHISVLR